MTFSSYWEGRSRAGLRIGLVLIVMLEYVFNLIFLYGTAHDSFFIPKEHYLLDLVPFSFWTAVALLVVGVTALIAILRDRRPLSWGVVIMICMALVEEYTLEIEGSPSHNFFYPGSMLFGWLAGLAFARECERQGASGASSGALREATAEAGAIGVLAALYVGSGVSKLLEAGLGWVDPFHLRATLLMQKGLADGPWVTALRELVIQHPLLSQYLSAAALVIELGGFVLLFRRPLRLLWGLLILGFHLQVFVLAGIPYLEPMLLVPLFTFPWPAIADRVAGRRVAVLPPTERPAGDDGSARLVLPPRRALVVALLVMSAAWLLPVRWGPHHQRIQRDPPPAASPSSN